MSKTLFYDQPTAWGALPSQKVSNTKKHTKQWQQACIDAIISMANMGNGDTRSPRYNKQINYDIVNSRFKTSDFLHVLYPHGLGEDKFIASTAKMQNYNIVRQAVESLKGEEMKLGIEFRAVAVNGDAVIEKNKERQKRIMEAIKARAMAIATGDIDPETGQPNAPDPTKVANAFKTEYAHPTEIAVNQLLQYLIKKDLIAMKMSQGWEHAIISAEEIYRLHIDKGHPSVRVCNTLNVSFDRETDNPFIHKSDWAIEERWMPRGAVIDAYGHRMSDDLIDRLDRGELGGMQITRNGMQPGFAYHPDGGMSMSSTSGSGRNGGSSHVYVADCVWRSWRKLGNLSYVNERTGMMENTTVDDSFTLTQQMKDEGWTVEWYWETEIWEGTKIGDRDYIGVQPMENQTGNLPYIGYVYNNVNSVATSLVDMIKPHQYTYIIVWWRLEQELAKAKGKKFIMDLAQLPKSRGWTVDQWMHYFDNMGVAWINSMEEGRKGDSNTISRFNQFQAIDMTLSNIVGQYMHILNKLEEQVERISGVSRQRAGDIGRSETATGAQRAIIQSTNNTKPLFFYHDIVRQTVLQELMELCKVAYIDGALIEHVVDPKTIETIKIDAGMLNGTDLGVFMSNSFEDAQNAEKLEQYLSVALQYDKANLSDIVSVLTTKSMSQIKDTIIGGERAKAERDQQAAESQQQALAQQMEAELSARERELEVKMLIAELDADTAIEVALIQASSSMKEDDPARNILAERQSALAERKQTLEEEIKKHKQKIEEQKLVETKRSNMAKESIARRKPTITPKK